MRLAYFPLATSPQAVYAYCMVRDFHDLLSRWTPRELASVLDVPYQTAAAIRRRGFARPEYWPRLIEAAETKSIQVTAAMLARFASERKARERAA